MTSLRLLRFAGLMLLLGSVASASAETVGERVKKDPSFQIYPVIFSVTATSNSTPPAVRVASIGKGRGKNYRKISEAEAAKIIPAAWIKAVKKIIQADPSKPKMKDGSRSRSSHISFTFRSVPISSCLTWTNRSTSNQDIEGQGKLSGYTI